MKKRLKKRLPNKRSAAGEVYIYIFPRTITTHKHTRTINSVLCVGGGEGEGNFRGSLEWGKGKQGGGVDGEGRRRRRKGRVAKKGKQWALMGCLFFFRK